MMFSFSDLSLFVISCDHVLTGDTTLHFLIISGLSDSSKATDQYHPVESQLYSDVIVYCDRGGAVDYSDNFVRAFHGC